MMTFLLFAPASTKWLGWRKDRKSRRDCSGGFCDIYCAVILWYSCVTQWHSVEQLFWKLWTKRHSISTGEVIRCVQLWIYKHLERHEFTNLWFILETLPRHSSSLFDWNKTQPQTSKKSEQRLQSWTKSVKNFALCYTQETHPAYLAPWWPLPPPLPGQCCLRGCKNVRATLQHCFLGGRGEYLEWTWL